MEEKVAVLNGAKMNYDGSLDFSGLSDNIVLYDDTTEEEFAEHIRGAAAIVTKEMPVTREMIAGMPESVRLICEAGTGYNNIDMDAAREKGLTVCNVPAYSSERVAHTAVMMMLNLSSFVQKQIRMLERGDRSNFTKCLQVPHTELNGKTLGVIGAGHIGQQVIRIAKAMDMHILAYTRTPREDEEDLKYVPLETLLRESDYVTLHCPLTADTRHLINAERLAMMKPTAFLINTGRGALIDEKALIEALRNGTIAGAGLDVQETEPPAQDNPLYDMENVILTPHMGWKGQETRQRMVDIVAADVQGFFAGKPVNVVS